MVGRTTDLSTDLLFTGFYISWYFLFSNLTLLIPIFTSTFTLSGHFSSLIITLSILGYPFLNEK